MAVIGLAGRYQHRGPSGIVRTVGEMLALHTHGRTAGISYPPFPFHCAVKKIADIELYARFVGEHLHSYTCGHVSEACGRMAHVAVTTEHHIVVVSAAVGELPVTGIKIPAYRPGGSEIERSAVDRAYLSRGHECGVNGSETVGIKPDYLVEDIPRGISAQAEIGMVGQIENGGAVRCRR